MLKDEPMNPGYLDLARFRRKHLDLPWVDSKSFDSKHSRRFGSLASLPSFLNHAVHFAPPKVAVSIESVVGFAAKTKIAGNGGATSGVRLDMSKLEATSLFAATTATVDEGAARAVALEHLAFVSSADVA